MASPIDLPPFTVTQGRTAAAASLWRPACHGSAGAPRRIADHSLCQVRGKLSQSARHECVRTQLGKVCPICVGEAADPGTGSWIGFPF